MSRYRDVILARGPVAYWPLDDAGPTYSDATGHGYTAMRGDSTGIFSAGSPPFPCAGPSLRFAVADTSEWCFLYMAGTLPAWPNALLPCGSNPFTYEYWAHLLGEDSNPIQLKTFVSTSGDRSLIEGPNFPFPTSVIHGRTDVGGFFTSQAAGHDTFDWTTWQYVVGVWTGSAWQFSVNGMQLSLILDTPATGHNFAPDGLSLGANFQVNFEAAHAAVYDRALTPTEIASGYDAARCAGVRVTLAPGAGAIRQTIGPGTTERLTING